MKINKKGIGIVWYKLVVIIITVLVLLGVLTYFFPQLISNSKDYIKLITKGPDESEFKPFTDQLTEEERSVDDSIKALVCAVESTASEKRIEEVCQDAEEPPTVDLDPNKDAKAEETSDNSATGNAAADSSNMKCCKLEKEDSIEYLRVADEKECEAKKTDEITATIAEISKCEESEKYDEKRMQRKGCKGRLYGNVCVECQNYKVSLSNDRKEAIAAIGQSILSCYTSSSKITQNTFCSKVNGNQKIGRISEDEISRWIQENTDQNEFPDLKSKIAIQDKVIDLSEPLIICAKSPAMMRNKIHLSKTSGECSSLYNRETIDTLNKEGCEVKHFELPQKMAGSDGFAEKWIYGAGDPDYLVYYQTFPMDETKYWQLDLYSFHPWIMVASGAMALFVPKEVKAGIGHISQGAMKKGLKEMFSKGLIISTLKFGRRLTSIAGLFKGVTKGQAERLVLMEEYLLSLSKSRKFLKNTVKLTEDGVYNELMPIVKKYLDGAGKVTNKAAFEKEVADFLYNKIAKSAVGGQDIMKLPGIGKKLPTLIENNAKKIAEGFDEPLKDLTLEQLKARRRYISFWQYFFEGSEFSEEAFIDFLKKNERNPQNLVKLVDSGVLSPKQLEKVFQASLKNVPYYERGIARALGSKLSDSGIQGAERKLISALDKSETSLFTREMINLAKRIPGMGLDSVYWAKKIAGTGASAIALPIWFTNNHRIMTSVGLGFIGSLLDSQNEKSFNRGANSIIVDRPSIFDLPDREYKMKYTNPYFVSLEGERRELKRFHLVSPCNANLTVSKKSISYKVDRDVSGYDLLDFGKGILKVNKGGLTFDNPRSEQLKKCPKISESQDFDKSDKFIPDKRCDEKIIGTPMPEADIECKGKMAYCHYENRFCAITCSENTPFDVDKAKKELLEAEEISAQTLTLMAQNKLKKENPLLYEALRRYQSIVIKYGPEPYLIPEMEGIVNEAKNAFIRISSRVYTKNYNDDYDIENLAWNGNELGSNLFSVNLLDMQHIGEFTSITLTPVTEASFTDYLKFWKRECLPNNDLIEKSENKAEVQRNKAMMERWEPFKRAMFEEMVNEDCALLTEEVSAIPSLILKYKEENKDISTCKDIDEEFRNKNESAYYFQCLVGAAYYPKIFDYEKTNWGNAVRKRMMKPEDFEKTIIPEVDRLNSISLGELDKADYEELLAVKNFYDQKAKFLGDELNSTDYQIWERALLKMEDMGKVKANEETTKITQKEDKVVNGASILKEPSFKTPKTINVKTSLDPSKEINYCFHGDHYVEETLADLVFWGSLFADKVVGGVFAAAGAALCSETVVGAPACGYAGYRIGAAGVDMGSMWLEHKIRKESVWPKH